MIETRDPYSVVPPPQTVAVRRRLQWFFPAVSGVLLGVLFVGFAPSFFLRGRISIPIPLVSMPLYLVVHGVVLTSWYGLVFAQTCLVAARRTDVHRRLGIITVGVALLVVPVSALVVIRAVQRGVAAGMERDFIRAVVVGDLSSLVFFSIFVGTAIYFRRRPDIHKRLMIGASFVIFGPALERYYFFYQLPRATNALPYIILVGLGTYDLLVAKRLHRATLWAGIGGLAVFVLLPGLLTPRAVDAFINAIIGVPT